MTRGCVVAMVLCLFLPQPALGQGRIEISLKNNTEQENQTKRQLERVLEKNKLSKWIFTKRVLIDEAARIPHSHPVLTLNTDYSNDDTRLISVFIHEQIHWHEELHPSQRDHAIAELEALFPSAPVRGPEGARDRNSTYLHLIVCYLEYEAMRELVGPEKAREVMSGWTHYTWVYKTVLDEGTKIRAILEKWKLTI
jgi:hypothetical protein